MLKLLRLFFARLLPRAAPLCFNAKTQIAIALTSLASEPIKRPSRVRGWPEFP